MFYLVVGGIITVFSIYSYAIDVLFGHKSFWQDWSVYLNSPIQRTSSDSNIKSLVFNMKKKIASGNFLSLNHDILVHILQYLNAKELLFMSSVNKYFNTVIAHNHLWKKLFENFIFYNPAIRNDKYIIGIYNEESKNLNKLTFHKIMAALPMNYITQYQTESLFLVIINKKLYNLMDFIYDHPGGTLMLLDIYSLILTYLLSFSCKREFGDRNVTKQ